MQPEAKLVKKIQEMVREAGGYPVKIHGGDNPFQAAGIPDLLCCIHGRYVGIETKLPGEKLRKLQRVALYEIFNAGGVAAVLETVGQGARLLSYLEKEVENAGRSSSWWHRAVCCDRGIISYKFKLS